MSSLPPTPHFLILRVSDQFTRKKLGQEKRELRMREAEDGGCLSHPFPRADILFSQVGSHLSCCLTSGKPHSSWYSYTREKSRTCEFS
ncbi:tyrosine aminotransferase, isoform CRA_b [Rattus norvegicus]|uniref:Tyrosine aminotransferase, isoform CRA_b n=1 Tax=Rattus norvegicus TaxID=10116 RepID=A6IZ45_RAT|nr:tyrosine aminotransferase, isoform CRA_b [Rattus norvegicus]